MESFAFNAAMVFWLIALLAGAIGCAGFGVWMLLRFIQGWRAGSMNVLLLSLSGLLLLGALAAGSSLKILLPAFVEESQPQATSHLEGKVISLDFVTKPPRIACSDGVVEDDGPKTYLALVVDRPSFVVVSTNPASRGLFRRVLMRSREFIISTGFNRTNLGWAVKEAGSWKVSNQYRRYQPRAEELCFQDGTRAINIWQF